MKGQGRQPERGSTHVSIVAVVGIVLAAVGGVRLVADRAVQKYRCQGGAVSAIGSTAGAADGECGTGSSVDAGDFRRFIDGLSQREVFHLSQLGTLSYALADPSRQGELSTEELRDLAESFSAEGIASEEGLIEFDRRIRDEPPYEHDTVADILIPGNRELVGLLEMLAASVTTGGLSGIDLREVARYADASYAARAKEPGASEFFYFYTRNGSPHEAEVAELSAEQLSELESVFRSEDPIRPSVLGGVGVRRRQRRALRSGELKPDELRELEAMAQANKLFEEATGLDDDIGGWVGNFLHGHGVFVENQTYCMNEATTYQQLLRRFESMNLAKHFEVEDEFALRRSRGWFGGIRWHVGVLLRNKRTGRHYVYDSWMRSGGSRAKVFSFEDWQHYRDRRYLAG